MLRYNIYIAAISKLCYTSVCLFNFGGIRFMEDFVIFDRVSKTYQVGDLEISAVKDVSFTIAKGEFTVIVAPAAPEKRRY